MPTRLRTPEASWGHYEGWVEINNPTGDGQDNWTEAEVYPRQLEEGEDSSQIARGWIVSEHGKVGVPERFISCLSLNCCASIFRNTESASSLTGSTENTRCTPTHQQKYSSTLIELMGSAPLVVTWTLKPSCRGKRMLGKDFARFGPLLHW